MPEIPPLPDLSVFDDLNKMEQKIRSLDIQDMGLTDLPALDDQAAIQNIQELLDDDLLKEPSEETLPADDE